MNPSAEWTFGLRLQRRQLLGFEGQDLLDVTARLVGSNIRVEQAAS